MSAKLQINFFFSFAIVYGKDEWNLYCENLEQSRYKLDTLLFDSRMSHEKPPTEFEEQVFAWRYFNSGENNWCLQNCKLTSFFFILQSYNLKKCPYKLYLKILRKRKLNIFYIQASGFTVMFLQKPLPRKSTKEVWDDDPTSTIRMLKIRPFSPVSKLMKKILLTKNEDFYIISA